jgi:hypothetical protein
MIKKEKIILLAQSLIVPYILEAKPRFHLTINYKHIISGYPEPDFNKESIDLIKEKCPDEFSSFNLTIKYEQKNDSGVGWRCCNFVFYGSIAMEQDIEENEECIKDPEDGCFFEYSYLGDGGDHRLTQRLYRVVGYGKVVYDNYVQYKNIKEHISNLIELDDMYDRQFYERRRIIEKLRNSQ